MSKIQFLIIVTLLAGCSLVLMTTQYYFLSPIPILALPVLFLFTRHPIVAYYLIVFFIPFSLFRGMTETYRFLTISKLAGAILILVILLQIIFRKASLSDMKSNLWPLLIFFILANILATVVSVFFPEPLNELRLLLTACVFFAMTLLLITRDRFENGLLTVLNLSITLGSLLSIIGYVFNVEMFAMNLAEGNLRRSVGAAGDPNFLACMIIFNIPLVIHKLERSARASERLFFFTSLFINVMGVVLTFSRSGGLVLGLTLLLACWRYFSRLTPKTSGLAISGLLVLASVAFISIPSSYWERQMSTVQGEDESIARRASYLQVAWSAFLRSPFLGEGTGMFPTLYAQSAFAQSFKTKDRERAAHNTYLEVLTGAGLIGMALFLLIIVRSFKNFSLAINNYTILRDYNALSLTKAYMISFIALLVYLLMLSDLTNKYLWMTFALSQVVLTLSTRAVAQRA